MRPQAHKKHDLTGCKIAEEISDSDGERTDIMMLSNEYFHEQWEKVRLSPQEAKNILLKRGDRNSIIR